MPLNHLARMLYPKFSDWRARKRFKIMIWVLLVAAMSAGLIAWLILHAANRK